MYISFNTVNLVIRISCYKLNVNNLFNLFTIFLNTLSLEENTVMIKTIQKMFRSLERKRALDTQTYRLLEMNNKLSIKKSR